MLKYKIPQIVTLIHKIPQIVTLTPPLEEMGYPTKKVRRNDEPFCSSSWT